MHAKDRTTGRTEIHRRRLTFRKTVALLSGALLAGASLTLAAPQAVADASVAAEDVQAVADVQQITLAKGEAEVGEPMSLAVLPDRSVLHTSRDGELRLTDAAGNTKLAGKPDVYAHDEEGLQGIGVDPDFADNRFIYLYYAPPLNTPAGDAPETGTAADFTKTPAHGGKTVGDIDNGDWISFTPYALGNATSLTARVSSGGAGGTLEIRAGSSTGTLLGKANVSVTGGWENFQDVTTPLTRAPRGTTTLYLVFKGATGSGALFDVDDFTFTTG